MTLAAWAVLAALGTCPEAVAAHASGPGADAICALVRPQPTATVDRAKLDEVLSRERYARARHRNSGAIQALLDRFAAWLKSFFASSGAQSYSQVTRFVVLTVASLLAVLGVLRLLGRSRRKPALARPSEAAASALALDDPQAHLARARAALVQAPREAIREGLLALLSSLEDARLARPDRVRTNHELVTELPTRGAPPGLVARIEPMVRWYDTAFYSLEPVPTEGAARFVDDVAQVNAALEAPSQ